MSRSMAPKSATSAGRSDHEHPPFWGSFGQIHLDEHARTRGPFGDLGPELGPVDALPQVDVRRQGADLVSLQPAEEVPSHTRRIDVVVGQLGHFAQHLLRVVLSDVVDAGGQRGQNGLDREGFGHGHEPYVRSTGPIHAGTHGGHPGGHVRGVDRASSRRRGVRRAARSTPPRHGGPRRVEPDANRSGLPSHAVQESAAPANGTPAPPSAAATAIGRSSAGAPPRVRLRTPGPYR